MRWAAAMRKWPLPQAGSQTLRLRMALLWIGLATGFVEHRVEGGVEQAGDQASGRVVAAGRLALVAAGRVEFEGRRIDMQDGVQFEQRFVDAAQFLGAEVA